MRITGGYEESNTVTGNVYDKYGSNNPIVRRMMGGFEASLKELVDEVKPETIHEVGCGEGRWTIEWNSQGYHARGSDFSSRVIELARQNAKNAGIEGEVFFQKSVYDIDTPSDTADLVVACEVLEHLQSPDAALAAITRTESPYLIASVPREPLWRMLNMARGKYVRSLGNTPGHVQHWSTKEFVDLLSRRLEVLRVQQPLPWTMVLCRNTENR